MQLENRDLKIQQWLEACKALAYYKNLEMELRKEISLYVLVEDKPESFSRKLHLGNGFGLEATQVLNYKMEEFDRTESVCIWLSQNGYPAKLLFKPKFEFSESQYKKLEPKYKIVVDEVISCKIGSPKLEFITPKDK